MSTKDLNAERIRLLVNELYETERELAELMRASKYDKKKTELKKLLVHTVDPNEKGQHVVIVDGLKAIAFQREGSITLDKQKAKELLHPNTFNALKKIGKASVVLKEIKVSDE